MPNQHTVVQDIRDYIADNNMMAVCNWSNVYDSYVVIYKSEYSNSWMLLRVNPSRKTYRIRYLKSVDIQPTTTTYVVDTNLGAISGIYTFKPQYFIEQELRAICARYSRPAFGNTTQPSTTRKVVN